MTQKPTQLNLSVFLRDHSTFDNYIAESDAAKIVKQSLINLAQGHHCENALLWGKLGNGLTHLLQSTCHVAAEQGLAVQYLPISEFLASSAENVLGNLAQLDILCIDDLELCAGKPDWERALFNLYNELKAQGHALVCAMHVSPSELAIELPDLRSRLLSAPTFQLAELSDESKMKALITRAQSVAMDLPKDVANFLLSRVSRDTEALFSMLEKLEEASLSQQRKLTIPFVKQELELT